MPAFRERLSPQPWVYVAVALVIPATILIFAPLDLGLGVFVALVLFGGCAFTLYTSSPIVSVVGDELIAGRARIPVAAIGFAEVHKGAEAHSELHERLDARAWLVIRGWIGPLVRISVDDIHDPVPYWLISSRKPTELVAAIGQAKNIIQRP